MCDMKPFGELSDAEKGALLLAHHEGKKIEILCGGVVWGRLPHMLWDDACIFRIAPDPLIPDSIDWSHVAPEVVAMARDSASARGDVRLYRAVPVKDSFYWLGHRVGLATTFASYRRGTVDWRDSLVVRPS